MFLMNKYVLGRQYDTYCSYCDIKTQKNQLNCIIYAHIMGKSEWTYGLCKRGTCD